MDGHELAEVAGAIGIFTTLTIVVVLIVSRITPNRRTRTDLARDQEYRELAERSARTQEELSRQLAAISGRLTDVEDRMSSVERVLRDVE